MGCVTVDVRPISPSVTVTTEERNDIAVAIDNAGSGIDVVTEERNDISVEAANVGNRLDVLFENKNGIAVDIVNAGNGISVSVEKKNDISVDVDNAGNGLDVEIENKNSTPTVEIEGRNIHIEVVIALVCWVSLKEKYEYFYVSEGPFVVKDGYFMVSRR